MRDKSRIVLFVLLIVSALFIVGCNEILPPELEIQDWELKQEYWWFVEGTAKNVGGNADYCEVDVKFYNENDTLLGTGLDNITDLDAGETWSFKAYLIDSGTPDHVEVKEGDCFQY